jgi:hypothetical protein
MSRTNPLAELIGYLRLFTTALQACFDAKDNETLLECRKAWNKVRMVLSGRFQTRLDAERVLLANAAKFMLVSRFDKRANRRTIQGVVAAICDLSEIVTPGSIDPSYQADTQRRQWEIFLRARSLLADLQELAARWPNEGGAETVGTKRESTKTSGAKPKRRRRRETDGTRPLTVKQTQAVQLYGELKGNFTAVGKRMGVSRQMAEKHYNRAMKKLGKRAMPNHKTATLPTDKRGQANIVDGEDRRE